MRLYALSCPCVFYCVNKYFNNIKQCKYLDHTYNLFSILTNKFLRNSSIGLTSEKLCTKTGSLHQTKFVYYPSSQHITLLIVQVGNSRTFVTFDTEQHCNIAMHFSKAKEALFVSICSQILIQI